METSRTVVVSGVPDVLPSNRMADKLTIHFQSVKRSDGGDVVGVQFPVDMEGVAFITFDRAEDAEKVVKKKQHILIDDEFQENYLLTVFPFSRDVFLYVPRATVDLSVFGSNQASLIDSLQSAHRSIRFRSLPQEGKAAIEGPFSAIKALREDLIERASCLQPSAQSPAVQHYSSTKPKQEPPSVRSDEPRGVQKPKTQSNSSRQRVSDDGWMRRSFSDENKALKAQGSRHISAKYGGTKNSVRQVVGEEANARVGSSLSTHDPFPVEQKSHKQPREDHLLEKHNISGRISEAETRQTQHLGSHYNYTDCMSSYTSKLNDSEDTRGLHQGDFEDIWVDLYTFKYLQKFDKKEWDRCFRGLSKDMFSYVERGGLMKLLLTEKQPTEEALRILGATLEELDTLMDVCQSLLRVHEIPYSKPDKQRLTRICEEVNSRLSNVLYIFEDSCIKIIGPSESSHLFCQRVKEKMALQGIPEDAH